MAFEELHQPLFMEHGSLYFANGKQPSKEFNYAFCEVCLVHMTCIETFSIVLSQQYNALTHDVHIHPHNCELT